MALDTLAPRAANRPMAWAKSACEAHFWVSHAGSKSCPMNKEVTLFTDLRAEDDDCGYPRTIENEDHRLWLVPRPSSFDMGDAYRADINTVRPYSEIGEVTKDELVELADAGRPVKTLKAARRVLDKLNARRHSDTVGHFFLVVDLNLDGRREKQRRDKGYDAASSMMDKEYQTARGAFTHKVRCSNRAAAVKSLDTPTPFLKVQVNVSSATGKLVDDEDDLGLNEDLETVECFVARLMRANRSGAGAPPPSRGGSIAAAAQSSAAAGGAAVAPPSAAVVVAPPAAGVRPTAVGDAPPSAAGTKRGADDLMPPLDAAAVVAPPAAGVVAPLVAAPPSAAEAAEAGRSAATSKRARRRGRGARDDGRRADGPLTSPEERRANERWLAARGGMRGARRHAVCVLQTTGFKSADGPVRRTQADALGATGDVVVHAPVAQPTVAACLDALAREVRRAHELELPPTRSVFLKAHGCGDSSQMLSSKGINGQFVYEMPVAQFVQGVLSVAPDVEHIHLWACCAVFHSKTARTALERVVHAHPTALAVTGYSNEIMYDTHDLTDIKLIEDQLFNFVLHTCSATMCERARAARESLSRARGQVRSFVMLANERAASAGRTRY